MFDLDKMRAKGMSDYQIELCRSINENTEKESSCKLHKFERVRINGIYTYKCNRCGCTEDTTFVLGYRRGLEHGKGGEKHEE